MLELVTFPISRKLQNRTIYDGFTIVGEVVMMLVDMGYGDNTCRYGLWG